MATEAQIAANQANAQHSTGPTTPEGKQNSSKNRIRHGLTGEFTVLPCEDLDAYGQLLYQLRADHAPTNTTEDLLIERMAQHHWLRHRAIYFQTLTLEDTTQKPRDRQRDFALYLRYQTTNERAFQNCLHDLLKLRAEKRKEEIGFESQKLQAADLARKQSIEKRKQELHKMDVFLAEGKAEHQQLLNARLETPETRDPNRLKRLIARTQAA